MARQNAQNIFEGDGETRAKLQEIYGKVVDNLQANLISMRTKNTNLSFSHAGSLEAKRFTNINSNDYGTARAARAGAALKAEPVSIVINKHKEIIEEVSKADIDAFGVIDIVGRRSENHKQSMARELERAFFKAIVDNGTTFTTIKTNPQDILEDAIVELETTKNSYVDGVDRDLMFIAASPSFYSLIKKYVNENVRNANVTQDSGKIFRFNGVEIESSHYLPATADFAIYVRGVTVAQPVQLQSEYIGERIPLSNDIAIELFYDYGTTCVTPDLAIVKASAIASTITFDATTNEGVAGTPTTVTGVVGSAYPELTGFIAPTKGENTFAGYFTAATNGTKIYNANGTVAGSTTVATATVTLYAQFTA